MNEQDLTKWDVVVDGPEASVYAGGRFRLVVRFPAQYPFQAPTVHFATKIYHPNVTNDDEGSICLAVLRQSDWKPSTRLASVLVLVRSVLAEPSLADAVEQAIAHEYRTNRPEYERKAKDWVARYAQ